MSLRSDDQLPPFGLARVVGCVLDRHDRTDEECHQAPTIRGGIVGLFRHAAHHGLSPRARCPTRGKEHTIRPPSVLAGRWFADWGRARRSSSAHSSANKGSDGLGIVLSVGQCAGGIWRGPL